MQMLPIVELLDNCETDAERADWLLRVPDGVVMRDFGMIRNILQQRAFRKGEDFLDMRFSSLCATRDAKGELPAAVRCMLECGRSAMRSIALLMRAEGGVQ